jgi:hypothetical protein
MWQITTDLETGVMTAVLEVLYLGSAQIPQALIEVPVLYNLFNSFLITCTFSVMFPYKNLKSCVRYILYEEWHR